MKVHLLVHLSCDRCATGFYCWVGANDDNDPSKWFVPLDQPSLSAFGSAHLAPKMEPTQHTRPA